MLLFLPTAIFLVVIVVLGLGLHNRLYTHIVARYSDLFEQANAELGLDITYDSISIHSLGTFQIEGVVATWHGSVIAVPSLVMHVNPFRIRPDQPLGFLRRIVAQQVDLQLDIDTIDMLQEQFSHDAAGRQWFSEHLDGLRIVAQNSSVALQVGASRYVAEQVDFFATLSDSSLSYDGSILIGMYNDAHDLLPFLVQDNNGQIRLNVSGTYDISTAANSAIVHISDISIGSLSIYPLSFDVQYQENQWLVTNKDLRDLHFTFVFSVADRLLHFELASDGIGYDELIAEEDSQMPVHGVLRGRYVFDVHGVYDISMNSVEYDVTFEIEKNQSRVLHISAHGNDQRVVIEKGLFSPSSGTAFLAGVFDFEQQNTQGMLQFDDFTIGNTQAMNGILHIGGVGVGVTHIASSNFSVGDAIVPNIAVDLQLAPSVWSVNLSVTFDAQQNQVASLVISNNRNVSGNDIAISLLRVNLNKIALLTSSVMLKNTPPLPTRLADFDVNARIEISTSATSTDVSVPFFNVTNRLVAQEVFSFRAIGDQKELSIESLVLGSPQDQLVGFAIIRNIAGQVYDFELSLDGASESYSMNARYRQNQFVRFSGSHGLAGVLLFLPQNQLRYNMQLTALPLKIADFSFILDFAFQGEFNSIDDWSATIPKVIITESDASRERKERLLNRRILPYRLTSSVFANPQRISFSQLLFRDHISLFRGEGQIALEDNGADIDFKLKSEQLAETISLDGYVPFTRDQTDLLVTAVTERLDVQHLPQNVMVGAIDSTISITRDQTGSLAGNMYLTLRDARIGQFPIEFATRGVFSRASVVLNSIDVYCHGYRVQNSFFEYDVDAGVITATLDVLQEERLSILHAEPLLVVDTPYPLIHSRLTIAVAMDRNPYTLLNRLMTAEVQIIPLDDFYTMPLAFSVHYDEINKRHIVSGGNAEALAGYIDDNNYFQIHASRDFPLAFSARGSIADGIVDVFVQDIFVDIENIPRIADFGFLRLTFGNLEGAMRIVGSVGSLEFYGRIKTNQVALLTTYVPVEVGPVDTFLILQGNELQLIETYARAGENKGAYFSAAFQLVRGELFDFLIHIRTPEDTVVPFKYDFHVVFVDVDASGEVTIRGSIGSMSVDGIVRGESGSLIARSARQIRERPNNAPRLSLNLNLSTGPQFEALWPTADFPILRAFPELGSRILLTTDAQDVIVLDGSVSFRGGEVFYFDRNFIIREGSLTMVSVDGRIDPLIDLRAEIREYLPRGPVSVFLLIEDDFLSHLTPRLEAIPALSRAEIATVLGGNIVELNTSSANINPLESARVAIDLAGDVVSRIAVLNSFERSLREVLGVFDILTVRTQVLQNIIYDILDTSNTTNTQSVARYLNNTDFFLGTYLAEHLFLQLELGLRVAEQNEYLLGGLDELRLNTAMSVEFQSPIGVLRWNLEPQFQDTFRVNSTIGLSWNIGY